MRVKSFRTKKNILIIVSILMIPVIVSVAVFSFLLSYVNGSIRNSEEIISDGIVSTVERDLQNILVELVRISESSDFRALVNDRNYGDSVVKAVQNKINDIKRACNFVESVFFISIFSGGGGGFLLSEMRFGNDGNFMEKFFNDSFFNYAVETELFESFLDAPHSTGYFLGASNKVSLMKVGLPLFNTDIRAVVFLNNLRFIQRINAVSDTADRTVFIRDQGGGFLVAGGGDDINYDYVRGLRGGRNVIAASDNNSGLDYFLRISPDYLNGLLLPIRIMMIVSVVIVAALLGILIFLFVRRNRAEIDALKEEKEGIQSEFEKVKPSVLSDIFGRLFQNKPVYDSIENICQKYDLRLIGKKITLLSMQSGEIINMFKKLKPSEIFDFLNEVAVQLRQNVKKHFSDFENQYVIEAETNYYIVLTSGADEGNAEISRKIVSACKSYQGENPGIDVSFAISNTVSGPYEISGQYSQAKDCRIFIELIGGLNEIVFYDKLVDKGEVRSDIRNELADITGYIKQRDFLQAKSKIAGLIADKLSNIDANILKLKMYSVIDVVTFELKEATAYFDGEFLSGLDFEKRLLQVNSVKQLQAEADNILEKLHIYTVENSGKNEWIDGIKDYIKKNYSDPNLNVSFLASQFNFNLSYLSRMFKKETGIGVFDYIQQERIKIAKEMLLNDIDIQDICLKTGFYDARAFIRTFKSIEGYTPSQFKRTVNFV